MITYLCADDIQNKLIQHRVEQLHIQLEFALLKNLKSQLIIYNAYENLYRELRLENIFRIHNEQIQHRVEQLHIQLEFALLKKINSQLIIYTVYNKNLQRADTWQYFQNSQ